MQVTGQILHPGNPGCDVVEQIDRLLEHGRASYIKDVRQAIPFVREALKLALMSGRNRYIVVCCEKLGICYRSIQDVSRARHYLNLALSRLETFADEPISRAVIYYNLGALDDYQGNSPSAFDHYRVALDHSDLSAWTAMPLSAMGNTYRQLGDHKAAAGALIQRFDVWQRSGDTLETEASSQNIATVHTQLNDWEEPIEALLESLMLYRQRGHRRGEALVLANLGSRYINRGDFVSGVDYLALALEISRELGMLQQEVDILIAIGSAYGLQGKLEKSLEFNLLALEKLHHTRSIVRWFVVLVEIADTYLRLEKFDEALMYAGQGLETAVSLGAREHEIRICRIMATAYENLSAPAMALEYYKRYLHLHEELADQEARQVVFAMRTRADAERNDRERQEYRAKVTQLEQDIEHKSEELSALSLRLVRKDELLRRLAGQVEKYARAGTVDLNALTGLLDAIRENPIDEAGWEAFERRLQEFQPEFLHRLAIRYSSLTPMELKVCALLKMNMSSKDISSVLNITLYTVNTHRRNIRTKLELAGGVNLTTFLTML